MPSLSTCKSVLLGLTACTVGVVFTPGVAGDEPGNLTATVTNLGVPPLVVPLDGTGVAVGGIAVAPTQMTFGSVLLATASPFQSFTVTNTGQGSVDGLALATSGDFALTQNTCPASLPPPACAAGVCVPATCGAAVVFTPSSPGTRTSSVAITTTSAGVLPASLALTGNGIPAGGLSVKPAVVSFGGVTLGMVSPAQTVTLSNASGPGATTLTGLTFSVAGDFSLAQNTCGIQLPPAASCTFAVTFSPSLPGTRIGSVTVHSATGRPSLPASREPDFPRPASPSPPACSTSARSRSARTLPPPAHRSESRLRRPQRPAHPDRLSLLSRLRELPHHPRCRPVLHRSLSLTSPPPERQSGLLLVSSSSLGVTSVQAQLSGTGVLPAALALTPGQPHLSSHHRRPIQPLPYPSPSPTPAACPCPLPASPLTGDPTPDFVLGARRCPPPSPPRLLLHPGQLPSAIRRRTHPPSSLPPVPPRGHQRQQRIQRDRPHPSRARISPGTTHLPSHAFESVQPDSTTNPLQRRPVGLTDLHLSLTAGYSLDPLRPPVPPSSGRLQLLLSVLFSPTTAGSIPGTLTASSAAAALLGASPATATLAGTGAYTPGIVASRLPPSLPFRSPASLCPRPPSPSRSPTRHALLA